MKFRMIIASAIIAVSLTGAAASSAVAALTEASENTSNVLFEGAWTKKTFNVEGVWSIYSENGKTFIKLSDGFQTRRGPDLKIFLSPQEASATTGKNATQGAIRVAQLTSNKGEQVYEIPAGVDLAKYRSVLIHCEAYSKLWAAANLTKA